MKFYRSVIYVICLLSSLSPSNASAQERYLDIVQKYRRPQFFSEFVALPGAHRDSIRVIGHIRLSYDNSFFVKTNDGKFSTDLTFSVEILQKNLAVARKIVRKSALVDSHEATTDRTKFIEAVFILSLKKDDYTATIEVANNDLQKSLRIEKQALKFSNAQVSSENQSLKMSEPMLISRPNLTSPQIDSEIDLKLLGVSGNGIYGEDFLAMVKLHLQNDSIESVNYALYEKNENEEKLVREGRVESNAIFPVSEIVAEQQQAKLAFKRQAGAPRQIALIDFKARTLHNAKFILKVKARTRKGEEVSTTKEFDNAWVNMPYPLYDIELAVRLMEDIMLNADEASRLLDGNNDEQRRKFLAFWKKQDPTPDTDYNEALAEYFTRVDYTFFNFYTNREFGWRTDRGKIYIRYGAPTDISREFPVNRPTREIWTYAAFNKRFVFADVTNSGNYELLSEGQIAGEEKTSSK